MIEEPPKVELKVNIYYWQMSLLRLRAQDHGITVERYVQSLIDKAAAEKWEEVFSK
jgi:hypothetical protein